MEYILAMMLVWLVMGVIRLEYLASNILEELKKK